MWEARAHLGLAAVLVAALVGCDYHTNELREKVAAVDLGLSIEGPATLTAGACQEYRVTLANFLGEVHADDDLLINLFWDGDSQGRAVDFFGSSACILSDWIGSATIKAGEVSTTTYFMSQTATELALRAEVEDSEGINVAEHYVVVVAAQLDSLELDVPWLSDEANPPPVPRLLAPFAAVFVDAFGNPVISVFRLQVIDP